ncbi:hypothetical protein SteCoe_11523 [Stentor coeruleus]|uniref:RING-type domain-containing protein n=1 Tax=Stentor coeruleus TaxID=5963 RepID=A0A1R2CD24_9CILI|nr:hypothetical protein SteCoe_11523 [Stentor coeruleus]
MESEHTDINLTWIKYSMKNVIFSGVIYSLCTFYLILWCLLGYTLIAPLSLILFQNLIGIYKTIRQLKTCCFQYLILADSILEILFIIFLIFSYFNYIKLIYSGIPLYISSLMLALVSYKNPSNYAICVHIFKIMFQWCCTVSFICLSLRLENVINWPCIFLIWPLWLLTAIVSLASFLYIFILIILWFRDRINILCPLCFFGNIFGTCLTFSIFLTGFSSFYDEKDVQFLVKVCIIFGSFLVLMTLSILIVFTKLLEWIFNIFGTEPESGLGNQVQGQKNLHSTHISLLISKISSTFYKITKQKQGKPQEEDQAKNSSSSSIKDCIICYGNDCDGMITPCGHSGICYDCAVKLLKEEKDCHICRMKIKSVLKISKRENKAILATEFITDRD